MISLTLPTLNGPNLLKAWRAAAKLPRGGALFTKTIWRFVPYTATVGAEVIELDERRSLLRLRDRRRVRNHLKCVHAIALANFAEATTGLAMVTGMPVGYRGIVTGLEMKYLLKARGTLLAKCSAPEITAEQSAYTVTTDITDASGEVVAVGTFFWKVSGPRTG